jgi:hypothetical protein
MQRVVLLCRERKGAVTGNPSLQLLQMACVFRLIKKKIRTNLKKKKLKRKKSKPIASISAKIKLIFWISAICAWYRCARLYTCAHQNKLPMQEKRIGYSHQTSSSE